MPSFESPTPVSPDVPGTRSLCTVATQTSDHSDIESRGGRRCPGLSSGPGPGRSQRLDTATSISPRRRVPPLEALDESVPPGVPSNESRSVVSHSADPFFQSTIRQQLQPAGSAGSDPQPETVHLLQQSSAGSPSASSATSGSSSRASAATHEAARTGQDSLPEASSTCLGRQESEQNSGQRSGGVRAMVGLFEQHSGKSQSSNTQMWESATANTAATRHLQQQIPVKPALSEDRDPFSGLLNGMGIAGLSMVGNQQQTGMLAGTAGTSRVGAAKSAGVPGAAARHVSAADSADDRHSRVLPPLSAAALSLIYDEPQRPSKPALDSPKPSTSGTAATILDAQAHGDPRQSETVRQRQRLFGGSIDAADAVPAGTSGPSTSGEGTPSGSGLASNGGVPFLGRRVMSSHSDEYISAGNSTMNSPAMTPRQVIILIASQFKHE